MLKIRRVTSEDSAILLKWRNTPEVYKYALTTKPVKLKDHMNWFQRALTDPLCVFYMGLNENTPCGSVRYQLNDEQTEAEVSISLAPEYWGRGIGTKLMALAEEHLKNETTVRVIHATVLNENANFSPYLIKLKKDI
jgi:RimJ/RimL family protein N-acetyltransferase